MMKRYFELMIRALTLCYVLLCYGSPVMAELSILSPSAGTVYHPGDSVTFEVVDTASEGPKQVYLYATLMQHSELLALPPFKLVFNIPPVFTGKDTLVVSATYADLTRVEKRVEINVVLPAGVVVKSISVDPKPIYLYKLPPDSDPDDVRVFERRGIGVGGVYTDGVKRNIAASTDGTTYASSNEQIVKVSAEGVVTAQGVGAATITVRNGPHSAEVKVEVDPYKP